MSSMILYSTVCVVILLKKTKQIENNKHYK